MSQHAVLDNNTHRDLRVRIEPNADLGDAIMSCVTVPAEFRQVQAHFPILFHKNQANGAFNAIALFGFENGENLFLEGGKWDALYRPLALSIQPFLIGRSADGDGPGQVHIDMDHARTGDANGVRLFDEGGQATPYLEDIASRLGLLDAGYRASEAFFAALRQHELLEPLTLEIELDDGAKRSLVGFHIIDEERLRALDAATLGELHEAGYLMPIFMALASLSHITELVARKNRREAHG
ncbi:multidrug transporter [Croceicoccus ponticola]|uniref:Multidrug transporter n=1 Tax=Croceicoccus ponticola TaxID=2217664 RepID=A0A437H134_9SPHN|nr:SapC family protein [Croceicoccus ponticola]RVQ69341.1 multidrug transporter [Croceicoccus ponticola]